MMNLTRLSPQGLTPANTVRGRVPLEPNTQAHTRHGGRELEGEESHIPVYRYPPCCSFSSFDFLYHL
jgi:hypothetical protein